MARAEKLWRLNARLFRSTEETLRTRSRLFGQPERFIRSDPGSSITDSGGSNRPGVRRDPIACPR